MQATSDLLVSAPMLNCLSASLVSFPLLSHQQHQRRASSRAWQMSIMTFVCLDLNLYNLQNDYI